MIKENIKIQNGVYVGSPINTSFSDSYIEVRDIEGRVYSDEIVSILPYLSKKHKQYNEWKLRQKSTNRFLDYLKDAENKTLLEVGCGNGWFTARCSTKVKRAIGVDVNFPELEQAARVFKNENLKFTYWDVFTETPFNQKFDIIVLNACVQYFPGFERLKSRLLDLITSDGEIHIIDSPFYLNEELEQAKQRTEAYYQEIGVSEMIKNYYHHSFDLIQDFEILYQPINSKLIKLIKGKDMPFGWYRFKR